MCVHDEMLLSYKHNRITLTPLPEHSYLNLKQLDSGEYIEGRKDLLALLISFRYLINRAYYRHLIKNISNFQKERMRVLSTLLVEKCS